MAGDPANVHVWETGDMFVHDPAVAFVAGTHIPADIDTALGVTWEPAGLMLGDPGAEFTRDIEETDLNAWQLKRFRTKFKNGKVDGACTLFEDNDVTDDLIDPEGVPMAKARYLAFVFVDPDTGHIERRFTKAKANVFVENDSQSEEPKGRPLRIRYYPDATGKIFSIQKGVPA
jgi:hypothetical protein